jgi:hypothetical protein
MPKSGAVFNDRELDPQLLFIEFEEPLDLGAIAAVNDLWFDATNFIPTESDSGYLIRPDIRRLQVLATPPVVEEVIEGIFSVESKTYIGGSPVSDEARVGVGLARQADKYIDDVDVTNLEGTSLHKVTSNQVAFKDFSTDTVIVDCAYPKGSDPPTKIRFQSDSSDFRLMMHGGKVIPQKDGRQALGYANLKMNAKVRVWYARLSQEVVESRCIAVPSTNVNVPIYKAPADHNAIQAIVDKTKEANAMQKYEQGFDVEVPSADDPKSLGGIVQTIVGLVDSAGSIVESIVSALKTTQDDKVAMYKDSSVISSGPRTFSIPAPKDSVNVVKTPRGSARVKPTDSKPRRRRRGR